jgi:hypothetical protein
MRIRAAAINPFRTTAAGGAMQRRFAAGRDRA